MSDVSSRAGRPASDSLRKIITPTTQKTTRKRILDGLRDEPELTRRDLAGRLGVTPDGINTICPY